jgi:prepilin signal peptidase PulO-like enzyme (type II secretory pathway)
VAGKRITGPKDLGISKEQIRKLIALRNKGKLNKNFRVLIKNGIPFVPSFLLAYLAAMFVGNLLVLLL